MNNIEAGFSTDVEVLRAIVPGIETKLRIGSPCYWYKNPRYGTWAKVSRFSTSVDAWRMAAYLNPSFGKWRWFINDVDGGVILLGNGRPRQYVAQMVGEHDRWALAMCKCVLLAHEDGAL